MKKTTLFFLSVILSSGAAMAQLTTSAEGGNKKAAVMERIGITDITVNYDRPAVNGREGKIWGQLVHTGFTNLGFGSSQASPWRAGANENTSIRFSTDVLIDGRHLPAGIYGFFIAYDPTESTLIFSKNSTSWGSYFYSEGEDALRVKIKPVALDKSVERLKFEFMDQTAKSAVVALQWEKLSFPFTVSVDLDKLQFESFRRELRGERSFSPGWQSYHQAARYTLDNNTNLEEGLAWANSAVFPPMGEANFTTLSTQAGLLSKLGQQSGADSVLRAAMPLANMQQLHQYGRQLIAARKPKEALEAFNLNLAKNSGQYTTLMGAARGYSANKDFTKALKYANEALLKAPDEASRKNTAAVIEKLKKKEDVN